MSLDCFGRLLDRITTGKKVQSSGHWLHCLGGSMSLDCFGGLLLFFFAGSLIKLQITTEKKVQSSGHWLECLLRTFDSLHPSR
jgi:hypothetical protein